MQWADIIVIQRNAFLTNINAMFRARYGYGKCVVVDLDDGYHYMPRYVGSYPLWHLGRIYPYEDKPQTYLELDYKPIEQLEWGVKLADAITTPSKVIQQDWVDRGHEHVYLIPNYIEASAYLPYRRNEREDKETITIGWGGSASHYHSFMNSRIQPAIRRVLTNNKNVRFIIAGNLWPAYEKIKHPSYDTRVEWVEWTEFKKWPQTLARFDIGIIPLDGVYDEMRSWLKPLEYALMGIPWIGTRNRMTEEFAHQGILVDNKTDQWYNAIMSVVENYDTTRTLFRQHQQWAEDQDIARNVGNLISRYEEIIRATTYDRST